MKKKLSVLVSLLLVFCMVPALSSAYSLIQVVRITHYQAVNVRSGPSSGYRVLGEVKPDDLFLYLGTENGWHCIQYTATSRGYVYGELSEVETVFYAEEEPEHYREPMVHITHYQAVNVRRGPGTGYGVMCEVHPGESYPYLGEAYGWYCIELNDGRTGYVSNTLTTLEGESWDILPGC